MPSNPYQSLVTLLSNILEAYTTAFFITNHKNRTLEMAAVQSLSRYLRQDHALPLEKSGILSQVQKVGQMVHMDKLQDTTPSIIAALPFYRDGESHIKGLFAMPILEGAGVLYVDTKYQWGFSDKQIKLIHETASVIEDLLAKEAIREKHKDSARILAFCKGMKQPEPGSFDFREYSGSFVEECADALDTEYAFLALRDPDDDHFQIIAATADCPKKLTHQNFLVKQGLIGHTFKSQKPLRIARMNSHAPDHFLFSPSEGLPHHGTTWAIPANLASGHQIVLAFLSRTVKDWGLDYLDSIIHAMQFYQLLLDKYFLKEECGHLKYYDAITGLHNARAFEARLDQLLEISIKQSLPLTMAMIQFNPWPMLLTGAPPNQIHLLQRDLAHGLRNHLPEDTYLGQLSENRFGIILQGLTARQAERFLSQMADFGRDFFSSRLQKIRIQPQLSWVSFPQDGASNNELWLLAYHRLYASSRSRIDG